MGDALTRGPAMRAAAVLSLLATAAALAGAGYMLVAPFYRGLSCQASPGAQQECVESSETLLEHEDDAWVLTIAAVPVLLTSGATLLTLRVPRLRALRWGLASVFLALCFMTGLTVGIFFLPSAVLLIISVGVDQARGDAIARASVGSR